MQRTFCTLAFVSAFWPASLQADGERYLIDVQHVIDLLTPVSERQEQRIAENCQNMALFGLTDDGVVGLVSLIPAERCRQHYELSTPAMHTILEEYLAGMRADACREASRLSPNGPGEEDWRRYDTFCRTGVFEYSTDPKNGTTKEVVISVTELLIMPALVCAAAAREIAPEQRGGYCTSSTPPDDPELLWSWGRLVGQMGLLPLNNFGSIRDDACAAYPSGDPTTPAAKFFADILGSARDVAAMTTRLEALRLECGPSDDWGLGHDKRPDVLCRHVYFPGSRWGNPDAAPTTLRAESFSDSLRIGIFDDAENGEVQICIVVGSGGI